MSKELYIAAYEDLVCEFIDEGMSEAEAEKKAEEMAYGRMRDNIADAVDWHRDLAKENFG